MTNNKQYRVGVLGATGFTGRQVAKYLEKVAAVEGIPWAMGGRNREKLDALRRESAPSAGCLHVDLREPDTVRTFAQSCDVVLNLAGPYAETGETVMTACVDASAHYIDLTGEIFWVREMIQKLGARANENKVKLIPVCGYESLPFDLGVLHVAQKLREALPGEKLQKVLVEAEFIVHDPRILLGNALSGGTTATLKTYLKKGDFKDALNPAALLEDIGNPDAVLRTNELDFISLPTSSTGEALAPMMPAPFINPQIIHRTNAQLNKGGREDGYLEEFEYREGMNLKSNVGFSPIADGLARAAGLSFQAAQFLAGDGMSAVRGFLTKALDLAGPGTGEGPPEDLLDRMDYRLKITGQSGKGTSVKSEVYGLGHPGYLSTANICAEAALALALEAEEDLGESYGVTTPAAGLGLSARVQERLKKAGLSFGEVIVG